jgi:hypothetical protein
LLQICLLKKSNGPKKVQQNSVMHFYHTYFTTKRPYKWPCFVPYICYDKKSEQKIKSFVVTLSHTIVTTKRPNKSLCFVSYTGYDKKTIKKTWLCPIPLLLQKVRTEGRVFWRNIVSDICYGKKTEQKTVLYSINLLWQKDQSICLLHFVSQSPLVIRVYSFQRKYEKHFCAPPWASQIFFFFKLGFFFENNFIFLFYYSFLTKSQMFSTLKVKFGNINQLFTNWTCWFPFSWFNLLVC